MIVRWPGIGDKTDRLRRRAVRAARSHRRPAPRRRDIDLLITNRRQPRQLEHVDRDLLHDTIGADNQLD